MLIETVNLHVNSVCNLRCAYCFGAFPEEHGGLDGEAWCRIIEQLPGACSFARERGSGRAVGCST